MEEKKINLEEFLCNHGVDGYKDSFKLILLDFGEQLLELAAENAILTHDEDVDHHFVENFPKNLYFEYQGFPESVSINEQSILDTIKQVE